MRTTRLANGGAMPRFCRSPLLPAAVILAFGAGLRADSPERTKLDTAKVAFDKSMEEYREAVGRWFDKEEDDARANPKAGVTEKVAQLKAERVEFGDKGSLPKRAPLNLRDRPGKAAALLVRAYTAAADGYSLQRKDDEAAAVMTELNKLLDAGLLPITDPVPKGTRWSGLKRGEVRAVPVTLQVDDRRGEAFTGTLSFTGTPRKYTVEGKVSRGRVTFNVKPNRGDLYQQSFAGSVVADELLLSVSGSAQNGVERNGTARLKLAK